MIEAISHFSGCSTVNPLIKQTGARGLLILLIRGWRYNDLRLQGNPS